MDEEILNEESLNESENTEDENIEDQNFDIGSDDLEDGGARFYNFIFVKHYPTPEDKVKIQAVKAKYIIYGEEMTAGTAEEPPHEHLQGFICFKSQTTVRSARKHLCGAYVRSKAHYSTFKQASDYCRGNYYKKKQNIWKPKNEVVYERGTLPMDPKAKAAFGGLDYDLAKAEALAGKEVSNSRIFIQYYDTMAKIRMNGHAKRYKQVTTIFELRPWQKVIVDMIKLPPNPRKIHWIVDVVGSAGKSELAKYLRLNNGAYVFTNSKVENMAYDLPLPAPNIFIMNLTRQIEGRVPYSYLECIKDGEVFSTKYYPIRKSFDSPHLFVFANFAPDMSVMSADRWDIIDVGAPTFNPQQATEAREFNNF